MNVSAFIRMVFLLPNVRLIPNVRTGFAMLIHAPKIIIGKLNPIGKVVLVRWYWLGGNAMLDMKGE